MAQLIEFASNHLALVAAFTAVLAALVASLLQGGGRLAVSPAEAVRLMNSEDAIPVDIRPAKAFHAGHLLKALHTTPEDIAAGAEKLAKHRDKPLIVCCDRGLSSVASAKALRAAGFNKAYSLKGGIEGWRAEGLPLGGGRQAL